MQLPLRQVPPRPVVSVQPVPSGSVALHVPFFRFLQGGHGFFVFLLFLAAVSVSPRRPRDPLRTAASTARRELAAVSERARESKRAPSMPDPSRRACERRWRPDA